MKGRNLNYLIVIVVLVVVALWVVWPSNPGLHLTIGGVQIDKPIDIRQGLDLQGGLQVLLEADTPPAEALPGGAMDTARTIVENRVNGLGVTEPVVLRQGDRRIIVELPGIKNPEDAIATLQQTGLLEFVDAGLENLEEGTVVRTTFAEGSALTSTDTVQVGAGAPMTVGEAVTGVTTVAGVAPIQSAGPVTETGQVYRTIMTGRDLDTADVGVDEMGRPEIRFKLKDSGAKIFADYTAKNIGRVLAIVLDKRIISSPTIQSAIPDGSGRITGRFTLDQARSVAVQLRYGALPVPLRVETIRSIGPTLGQDSINKSITAGIIAIVVVLVFMIVYYRILGVFAAIALLIYGILNLALYKWGIPSFGVPFFTPITLTLPGITGFILSTGMAVDANVLIFERMKEEIRNGRSLAAALDVGFDRAWTSIRDSNISTLLTCVVLYWFGSNFGAGIVRGFAVTLFIGVLISMFTAITVSRTFIRHFFFFTGETFHSPDKLPLLGMPGANVPPSKLEQTRVTRS